MLKFALFLLLTVYCHADLNVVVVGGGPTGLSSAIEAAQNGARVLVLEKRDAYERNQTLFLANSSVALLEKWGVDVPEMSVAEFENEKLGFVPINKLEEALEKRARALGVEFIQGEFIDFGTGKRIFFFHEGRKHALNYELLIAADGTHSKVREKLGISEGKMGEASAAFALVPFPKEAFEITEAVQVEGAFVRKIATPRCTIVFAQSGGRLKKMDEGALESAVRSCGWEKEADAISQKTALVRTDISVRLQQAASFSDRKRRAILVGDAAACGSFFQGMGANTSFKTAELAGELIKNLQRKSPAAFEKFDQAMKQTTDALIEDSRFLFP